MKQTKTTVLLAVSILFAVYLLCEPELAAKELRKGLMVCTDMIIPSLFPFLLLSSFLTASGGAGKLGHLLSGISKRALALSGVCGSVIIMGLVGGYPTGARMACQLYECGEISRAESRRLLWFCVNPGPSFVIGTVGISLFGSKKTGALIYIAVIVSSVLIGIATGIVKRIANKYKREEPPELPRRVLPSEQHATLAEAFVSAVAGASGAMLSICAWALAFQVMISCLSLLKIPSAIESVIGAMLEITLGLSAAPGTLSIPTAAFLLSFGGVCVHFQVMSCVMAAKMKYTEFFLARLLNGVLSAGICVILTRIFPPEVSVFSTGMTVLPQALSLSFPAACALLMTCGIFLLDNKR